jgi:hypothetical protein
MGYHMLLLLLLLSERNTELRDVNSVFDEGLAEGPTPLLDRLTSRIYGWFRRWEFVASVIIHALEKRKNPWEKGGITLQTYDGRGMLGGPVKRL